MKPAWRGGRAQDKGKRELVDLKNQADSLAYQSEKQLKDAPADKLPADVQSTARARAAAGCQGRGCVHGGAQGCRGAAPACRELGGRGALCPRMCTCRQAGIRQLRLPPPPRWQHLTDSPGCDVLHPVQCERAAAGLLADRARAVMLRPMSSGWWGVG